MSPREAVLNSGGRSGGAAVPREELDGLTMGDIRRDHASSSSTAIGAFRNSGAKLSPRRRTLLVNPAGYRKTLPLFSHTGQPIRYSFTLRYKFPKSLDTLIL